MTQTNSKTSLELFSRFGFQDLPPPASTLAEPLFDEQTLKINLLQNFQTLGILGLKNYKAYFLAQEWLKKNRNRQLIFFETDKQAFSTFITLKESEKILNHPQVYFVFCKQTDNRIEFSPLEILSIINPQQFFFHFSREAVEDRKLIELIYRQLRYELVDFEIKQSNLSPLYDENFFGKLSDINDWIDGTQLKDAFKGVRGIVCGAGPSLKNDREALLINKDRAFIFGAGTGVLGLNRLQIFSSGVVGFDPLKTQDSRAKQSLEFVTPLYFHSQYRLDAYSNSQGPKIFIPSKSHIPLYDAILSELLGIPLTIEVWGLSSSCFGAITALYLGMEEIVFCGLDLGYSSSKKYVEGVEAHPHDEKEVRNDFSLSDINQIKAINSEGNEITTSLTFISEAGFLSKLALNNKQASFYNSSMEGLGISKVPRTPLGQLPIPDFSDRLGLEHTLLETAGGFNIEAEKITQIFSKWRTLIEKDDPLIYELYLKKCVEAFDIANAKERVKLKYAPLQTNGWRTDYESKKNEFLQERKNNLLTLLDKSLLKFKPGKPKEKAAFTHVFEKNMSIYKTDKGVVLAKSQFKDNLRDGKTCLYYLNGTLYADLEFKEGKQVNTPKYYHPNGSLKLEMEFKEGLLSGWVKLFYEEGKLYKEISFLNGMKQGFERIYYPSGQIQEENQYDQGSPIGKGSFWHPNGVLASQIYHFKGKKDETFWNEKGILTKHTEEMSQAYPEKRIMRLLDKIEKLDLNG